MSDSDRPSRVSTAVAPATARPSADTVLGTAAASPSAYSAATAQEAATALVHMLMEQVVLGPGAVEPEIRAGDAGAEPRGPDCCPIPLRTGGDQPDEPSATRARGTDNGEGRRR